MNRLVIMVLSITSLKLKNPLYFFIAPYFSLKAIIQLQTKSKCVKYKTFGMGLTSYTMTLWNNEHDMLEYYRQGAHAEAMKKATKYAKEIRSLRLDRNDLIQLSEIKELLKNAKVINPN